MVFIHITKTAGTSVARTLDCNRPQKDKIKKHHSAKEIAQLIGETKYHQAYKFCFVRNPWERLLSYFRFKKKKTEHFDYYLYKPYDDFNDWFLSYEFDRAVSLDYHLKRTQVDWITGPNGQIEMDFIGRFENLEEDFKTVCKRINVAEPQLLQLNKSTDEGHYRKIYSAESIKKAEEFYQRDIEYFGYTF